MKNKKILIIIIIVFCFVGAIIFLYPYLRKNVEGAEIGASSIKNSASTGTSSSPSSIENSASTGTSKSPLERFTDALTSAFSPPVSTEPQSDIAKPAWANSKVFSSDSIVKDSPAANCEKKIQTAINPLPVDEQAKTTIEDHSKTVMGILDSYESQLAKFEKMLATPDNILALNPRVASVVNLGVPTVSVSYDNYSNSIIELSVVNGEDGPPGRQPDPITGIGTVGDIGKAGLAGINPLDNSNPPYWAR